MRRTKITIEDWQYDTLRASAEQEGRSISDLVRKVLQATLAKPARRKHKPDTISGIGEDAVVFGKNHDRFLYGDKAVD